MIEPLSMEDLAREVALDIPDGSCVNLGIGLPLRVALYVPAGREFVLHSENGILGVGPPPASGEEDWNLIDAGKNPITLLPGGSYMSHNDSFCLVRGGHVDVSVMGAYQVTPSGDLANWWQGSGVPGVGGAMDLAACARAVLVLMRHTERDGSAKIVPECTYPLTGRGVVTRIYTELGIFEPCGSAVRAVALARGVDAAYVGERTAVPVIVDAETATLPREM